MLRTLLILAIFAVLSAPTTGWTASKTTEIIAAAGDASISREAGATWTIGNSDISASLEVDPSRGPRLLQLRNNVTGRSWGIAAAPDALATIGGVTAAVGNAGAGYRLDNVTTSTTDRRVELIVSF